MKKITTIAIAFAMTLLVAGFALASSDMKMDGKTMSAHEGMQIMEDNLDMMNKDVEMMKDATKRKEAMASMDKHMTDMHHGMMAVEKHAKDSGNKGMQDSMKQINKDMMMVMKAMGKMKKDPDAAISMMQNGNMKMEKAMKKMKSKM